MQTSLSPAAPASTRCKCCGAPARLFGVVDFARSCEVRRDPRPVQLSGVPVYYHRCDGCGFLFTAAFDRFGSDDFARHIYNDEYVLADPDFPSVRPRGNAEMITHLFGGSKHIRILDFGGGSGLLARLLREAGFPHVDCYDPFVPDHATRPSGTYDLILCFEVVEHSPDPASTFREISSLLDPDGMVLFSTLLQPEELAARGVDWWYIAPRNGHVSLHSVDSLAHVTEPLGFNYGAFHEGLHVLFRKLPRFASHLV